MSLAALLLLIAITLLVGVYVIRRVIKDRQDDALDAFYQRLEARPEAYDPWLAELDAAGPDREG